MKRATGLRETELLDDLRELGTTGGRGPWPFGHVGRWSDGREAGCGSGAAYHPEVAVDRIGHTADRVLVGDANGDDGVGHVQDLDGAQA